MKEKYRELISKNCSKLFEKNNGLLLEWATGVGKTINAIKLQSSLGIPKTLILVAEVAHKDVWISEYIKHGYEYLLKNTRISCYASIKKHVEQEFDLIIFDEIHHLFSDLRIESLSKIKYSKVIGLSATLDMEKINQNLELLLNPLVYTISFEEAISMGLLNMPEINIIVTNLNDKYLSEEITFKRGKPKDTIICNFDQRSSFIFNKKKYPNLNLKIKCTQKQKYLYLTQDVEYAKRRAIFNNNNQSLSKLWMFKSIERKRFVSKAKTDLLKIMCDKIKDKRYVCFCGSIEQADYLGGHNSINSKNKKSKDIINMFNDMKISNLYLVNMLNEGQNLTGLDCAIIGSMDGVDRPIIQKIGRSMRSETPVIHILCMYDTKEMEYLDKFLEFAPSKAVKKYNFDSWMKL